MAGDRKLYLAEMREAVDEVCDTYDIEAWELVDVLEQLLAESREVEKEDAMYARGRPQLAAGSDGSSDDA